MKLSEKIYDCRKRSGKSQEALAEQLGVSRQAVSKWETGDAVPEVTKLKALADAFGVTVDWLLSEEEPKEELSQEPAQEPSQELSQEPAPQAGTSTSWVDGVPGAIGRLLRRYGWLFGVYTAVVGVLFSLIGVLTRVLTGRMIASQGGKAGDLFSGFGGSAVWGDQVSGTISALASDNPVSILGTVMIVIGVVLIVVGVVLAVVLWRRREK